MKLYASAVRIKEARGIAIKVRDASGSDLSNGAFGRCIVANWLIVAESPLAVWTGIHVQDCAFSIHAVKRTIIVLLAPTSRRLAPLISRRKGNPRVGGCLVRRNTLFWRLAIRVASRTATSNKSMNALIRIGLLASGYAFWVYTTVIIGALIIVGAWRKNVRTTIKYGLIDALAIDAGIGRARVVIAAVCATGALITRLIVAQGAYVVFADIGNPRLFGIAITVGTAPLAWHGSSYEWQQQDHGHFGYAAVDTSRV